MATISNQWAATFSQPASFGTTPPALQSLPVALTPANSVGGGSGTPTAGNWLMVLTGMNEQSAASGFTCGVGDDIRGFWRPGDETKSSWAVSPASALTRTSIWYTANTTRAAGYVYVAPNGAFDALSVLVLEISGLGPWDTVTGIFSSYAAAATSLNLALAAPSAQAFLVAAVCGDSTVAGQAFAPASWTALHTVSATNGADHTCDAVLTSACITTSGSISVNASASSAADLSGVVIGVLTSAPSPVSGTSGVAPGWAGRVICEFAPGSGFETPEDQRTWVTLSDPQGTARRLWSWSDKGGIPYALGQLQSGSGGTQFDNIDGGLSPVNPGSPWYSSALNSNMSFQSGVPPWTATGGAALAQSAAQAFASAPAADPVSSLKVTPNGTTATPGAASEQEAATAGSAYSASAWFYSAAGWATGAQVAISWYNSSHTLISTVTSSALAIPAAAFTQVALLNQTAPAGTAFAAVTVQFAGTPAAAAPFWVAEAAIAPGSSAVSTGLITSGVPVRLRLALGTTGGTTWNRWYVIARNAAAWAEKRTARTYRSYVETGLTDIWSVMSASCPTPYRGEIQQDNPGWWWPMDDQPLSGGVQPVSLRNAAQGSTTVLSITANGSGVSSADAYSTTGVDVTATGTNSVTPPNPSVAVYAVGQQQGWMYGDPQSSPASYATANPVTSNPGSAAWQQSGLQGNTGAQTWYLAANDTFPPLSGGVTVKGWFNAGFAGSATGYTVSTNRYQVAAQPVAPITLCTLSTGSAPVCELQLDSSGHLNLITFSGTTPTSNSVYSSSDLRSGSWVSVDITLTATTWAVYVNGGLTASASGSATGMSNFTWVTFNGDYGNTNGAALSSANIVHGGNAAYSHWAVFSGILPKWRLLAHYCAAITGFGLLPAPQGLSLSRVANLLAGAGYTPDGSEFKGSYGQSGASIFSYALVALAVAQAGSFTSGPSARAVVAGYGTDSGGQFFGDAVWAGLTSLAPSAAIYTASAANAETNAATVCGSGDAFTTGYGSGAAGAGVCQTAAGTGAAPPASPSSLGDTVQQRLERILAYGGVTYPMRCIDPAALLVQAALDVGGQQAGASVTAIVSSDNGLALIGNNGEIVYQMRSHLASGTAIWQLGPNTAGGQIPYAADIGFSSDSQTVYTSVQVTPYSPDGATLATVVPANAAAVNAAQRQSGTRPLQVTSYLQDASKQQSQANWLFAQFGTLRRRVEVLTIDAAAHPRAWGLWAGGCTGDLAFVQDMPFGPPVTTGTYRIMQLARGLSNGANGNPVQAQIRLVLSPEPSSYWS